MKVVLDTGKGPNSEYSLRYEITTLFEVPVWDSIRLFFFGGGGAWDGTKEVVGLGGCLSAGNSTILMTFVVEKAKHAWQWLADWSFLVAGAGGTRGWMFTVLLLGLGKRSWDRFG